MELSWEQGPILTSLALPTRDWIWFRWSRFMNLMSSRLKLQTVVLRTFGSAWYPGGGLSVGINLRKGPIMKSLFSVHTSLQTSLQTIAVLMAGAFVGAACVADDPDPEVAVLASDGEIQIELSEFAFLPSSITVAAGTEVTLVLTNQGSAPHEFMLGSEVRDGGGYEVDLLGRMVTSIEGTGYSVEGLEEVVGEDHDEAAPDASHEEAAAQIDPGDNSMDSMEQAGIAHTGSEITVEPGGRVVLTATVPGDASGDWDFGCFIKGHFEAGMYGTFTVASGVE